MRISVLLLLALALCACGAASPRSNDRAPSLTLAEELEAARREAMPAEVALKSAPDEPITAAAPIEDSAAQAARLRAASLKAASKPPSGSKPPTDRAAAAPVAPRKVALDPRGVALDPANATSILYGLHLASYRSEPTATRGWEVIEHAAPAALDGLTARVETVDLGPEKGVFLRLKAGPIPARGEAEARCATLEKAGFHCRITTFEGARLPG